MSTGPPDCVIVQPIAEGGLALLRAAGLRPHVAPEPDFAAMAPVLARAIAVITRNAGFPASAIAAAPQLLVIGSHGSGTDAIDAAAAAERGVAVVSTPGANARSVAELTLGLVLAAARRLAAADHAVRTGDHGFRARFDGMELHGRSLGLVGFGPVAKAVAPLARAFGMAVTGFSRRASDAEMAAAGVSRMGDLHALLAASDIVSLHAAGASGVLLGAAEIARMKRGAILVNTGRGSLLDESALAEALQSERLAAAALDVTAVEPLPAAHPLLRAPNLILTPHIGGSTVAALEQTAEQVARKVLEELRRRGALPT